VQVEQTLRKPRRIWSSATTVRGNFAADLLQVQQGPNTDTTNPSTSSRAGSLSIAIARPTGWARQVLRHDGRTVTADLPAAMARAVEQELNPTPMLAIGGRL